MTNLDKTDPYDLSLDELADVLADFAPKQKKATSSAVEERIVSGFEEIRRFYRTKKSLPTTGAADIFERLLAIRLAAIKENKTCLAVLEGRDPEGVLSMEIPEEVAVQDMTDDELENLLKGDLEDDLFDLKHVRTFDERSQPEMVAERKPCEDFERYRNLFKAVNLDLRQGVRSYYSLEGGANKRVEKGQFYVMGGQIAYIADIGEYFKTAQNRPDARMKVIFANGTESTPLVRSFQRKMYDDPGARGITDPTLIGLFKPQVDTELKANGTIYVLRSKADIPIIAKHRNLIHKIGVTTQPIEARIANAVNDPTYLLADVEIVATYDLYGFNPRKIEDLIHQVFAKVQLDIEIEDRFGKMVRPREWYLVPRSVVDELIEHIHRGDLLDLRYDEKQARLVHD